MKHDESLPIPCPLDYNLEDHNFRPDLEDEEMEYTVDLAGQSSPNDQEYSYICTDSEKKLFNQKKLNNLIRGLNLSKEKSEILASRLKENNLLDRDVKISYHRKRNFGLKEYFSVDGPLYFCHAIPGLFSSIDQPYNTSDWRFFIDSSQRSLKAVLLHNGNIWPSIPIAHLVHFKKTYENMKTLMEAIRYESQNRFISGGFKVIGMLMGMQPGFIKTRLLPLLCHNRDVKQHYSKIDWQLRATYVPGENNVRFVPLVDHIKLGLMKSFVNANGKKRFCRLSVTRFKISKSMRRKAKRRSFCWPTNSRSFEK